MTCTAFAARQSDGSEEKPASTQGPEGKPECPGKVDVQPIAKDDEITRRIADILKTTSWFGEPKVTGYVQRLTSRTTVLMTLDGNQVQVPNSTVFKRESFNSIVICGYQLKARGSQSKRV